MKYTVKEDTQATDVYTANTWCGMSDFRLYLHTKWSVVTGWGGLTKQR